MRDALAGQDAAGAPAPACRRRAGRSTARRGARRRPRARRVPDVTVSTITPTSSGRPRRAAHRLADRREERRLAGLRGVGRLEPEPHARGAGGGGRSAGAPSTHDRARLVLAASPTGRSGRARRRARGGQATHARAERLDALGRVGGPLHARQRELKQRRDLGHAIGGAEARSRAAAAALAASSPRQLELPDADPVEAGRRRRRDVLGERGRRRRDLAERDLHSGRRPRSLPAASEPRSRAARRGGRSSCLATR